MTSEYDKAYNHGYAKGKRDAGIALESPAGKLRERLNYLKLGGGFHRETTGDLYIQGFLDAMATLGVKP